MDPRWIRQAALATTLAALACLSLTSPSHGWEVRRSEFPSFGEAYLAGDLDADGLEEIVDLRVEPQLSQVVIYHLEETGNHRAPQWIEGLVRIQPIRGAAGDLDGDGYSDFIVVHRGNGLHDEMELFRGQAAPAAPIQLSLGPMLPGRYIRSITGLGDLDEDGFGELLVLCEGGGPAYLFRGDPVAGLVQLHELPSPSGRPEDFALGGAALGDFNGDGYRDFAIGEGSDGVEEAKVYIYHGGPNLDAVADQQLVTGTNFGVVPQIAEAIFGVGDVDGDGRQDLVAGAGGQFLLFLGNAGGGATTASVRLVGERGVGMPSRPGAGPIGPNPMDGRHLFALAGDALPGPPAPVHELFVYAWDPAASGGDLPPYFSSCGVNVPPNGAEGNLDRWLGTADFDADGLREPMTGVGLVRHREFFHDCNDDDLDDGPQVASGQLEDCDGDGLADLCQAPDPTADCDGNGFYDYCDISSGRAEDCNGDGIPDSCQLDSTTDCNGNGLLDSCEIAAGAPDCQGDGILDECQPGASGDCNNNGVLDCSEIVSGAAQDCDQNGIPDDCQVGPTEDCDENGVPDACDIASGAVEDCNSDGIPDRCQLGPGEDCNNNGILDSCELASGAGDCNANGVFDACELGPANDCDGDGTLDSCELASGIGDCDGNGVFDACQPDYTGDCNGNDIADSCELEQGTAQDCDGNGVPDSCQLSSQQDCNSNGVPDSCEPSLFEDCDGNGVFDQCEYTPTRDCNGNGVLDRCDIASGTSQDCDDDGTPDSCEPPGDDQVGENNNCPNRIFQGLYDSEELDSRFVASVAQGEVFHLWLAVEHQAANAGLLQLQAIQGEISGYGELSVLSVTPLFPGYDGESTAARYAIGFDQPVQLAPGQRIAVARVTFYAASGPVTGALEITSQGLGSGGFAEDARPLWFDERWLAAPYLETLPAVVNGTPPATGTGDLNHAPRLAVAAHPNPFNPRATVRWAVPAAGVARLSLFDGRGRQVLVLHEGPAPAGQHEAQLDGRGLASGSYQLVLETGSGMISTAVVLLK